MLTRRTATELAALIRSRDVSAVEVLDAHLDRIDRWNPVLNAVVTLDVDRAYRRAEAADEALEAGIVWGPLHGVPMTVKDQFSTAHVRTTYGLVEYRTFVPDTDAPLVARLHRAGAVLFGKTNLPTAAYDWQSSNPMFGRTNNPWDLGRTPGGSSGGSAAALAARLVPLELGADVGGSIRLPSHFCGIYGLRPTEHALPLDGITPPDRPRTVRHIVVPGPMARSLEDLQLAWDVLRTPVREPLPTPATNGHTPAPIRPDDLTVRVTTQFLDAPPDADTRRVVQGVAEALADAGAAVRSTPPPIDLEDALRVWGKIQGYELTAGLPAPLRALPVKTLIWHLGVRAFYGYLASYLARGAHLSARGYLTALDEKEHLSRQLDAALTDADLWITPVTGVPAFPHCRTGTDLQVDDATQPYAKPLATYLCPTALTGHPILTIPAGRSRDGLPIGVQVHARRGRDAWLLRAGHALVAALDGEGVHDVPAAVTGAVYPKS